MIRSIRIAFLCLSLCLISRAARAQDIPSDYQDVLKSLDRKGDFKAGVLKVNIPRSDLKMTVQGVPTPTPFWLRRLDRADESFGWHGCNDGRPCSFAGGSESRDVRSPR